MLKINALKVASSTLLSLSWMVRNIVIMPAGIVFLLICLTFIHDQSTPGKLIVDLIQNSQDITEGGQWKWRQCEPAANGAPFPVLSEDCPEVVSDAAGYAKRIDRTLWTTLGTLWLVVAMSLCGVSLLAGGRSKSARPNKDTTL
ncbi:hypothetical protein Q3R63_004401 [Salmonella enterica]|nr:hypothetical protein [Salmonella enterica subsp. enterica]EDV1188844.1 hypothetical protein [Salmonella enterica subsp. enterica]EJO8074280.1 hypothetical protein [Salmonella enterica]ELM1533866.1 hypothetical protein [Salmonella enterica]